MEIIGAIPKGIDKIPQVKSLSSSSVFGLI
jgi:hypothetical protein